MSGYFLAKHATLSGPVSTRPCSVPALEPTPLVFLADVIMFVDSQTAEERRARWAVHAGAAGSNWPRASRREVRCPGRDWTLPAIRSSIPQGDRPS